MLWAEIPLVNDITDSAAFTANARQQLTELIRQNYNHPSVLFWGIGNEQRADNTPTNTLLTALNTLVHQEDPGRLSTYAQCCTSDTGGLPAHTDVVGYNTYYGWYDAFGTADQFGAWADNLHATQADLEDRHQRIRRRRRHHAARRQPDGPRSLRHAPPRGVAEPGARDRTGSR